MIKRSLVLFLLVGSFMLASVSAVSITNTTVNGTLRTVSVSDAKNLYAYEVNLAYEGTVSVSNGDFFNFLQSEGDSTTRGSDEKNNVISVYESILDAESYGVNGSGDLFNVTHSSTLTLSSAVLILGNGTEITINFTSGEVEVDDDTPRGGGGGGGGGARGGSLDPIELEQDTLYIETFPGETVWNNVALENTRVSGLDVISVEVQGLEGILEVDQDSFKIPASGSYDVVLKFDVPIDTVPDIYTGRVLFVTEEFTAVLNIILDVKSVKGALFDVEITLPDDEFAPGEDIVAVIDVFNFGNIEVPFDFTLFYAIKDFEGRTLAFFEGPVKIESRTGVSAPLTIPRDAQPGEYLFTAKASHEGAVASASKSFRVVGVALSPFTGNVFLIILGVAVLVIAIVIVIVIFHFRGKKKVSVRASQPQDMKKQFSEEGEAFG